MTDPQSIFQSNSLPPAGASDKMLADFHAAYPLIDLAHPDESQLSILKAWLATCGARDTLHAGEGERK